MAYNNDNQNYTIHLRTFYVFYIILDDNGNGHFIFKLSPKQILVTKKYQPIHAPRDLIKTINEVDSFNNKIRTNNFDSGNFIC